MTHLCVSEQNLKHNNFVDALKCVMLTHFFLLCSINSIGHTTCVQKSSRRNTNVSRFHKIIYTVKKLRYLLGNIDRSDVEHLVN